MAKKVNNEAQALAWLEDHPKVDCVFMTDDGQFFTELGYADAHNLARVRGEVKKVSRKKSAAPKKEESK